MSRKLSSIPGSFLAGHFATEDVNLEDFAAFHNLPEDLKKKQIESFRFANSVFPFFIPAEHHAINLSSQLKNSKGEYWGNAAHFLVCNKAHGIPLWKRFEAQIQSLDTKITCRPHISTNMTSRILEHINEKDDSNFLVFQNWVLLQLPFQPILLFQWLTSVMYYLTRIESQMADLYYVPFPEKFKPELLCLHKMLKKAHRNIGFLFDYLQHQIRCEPDIYVGNLKVFEEILHEIIVFLKFWLRAGSDKCLSDLLKVREESLKSDEKVFQLKRERMALKERNFLFNLDFWRGPGPYLKIFGNSNEEFVRKRDTGGHVDRKNITNIISEIFFDPDDVKRVDKNLMLHDDDFLPIQRKIIQLREICYSTWIENTGSGIIGPVLENNFNVEVNYSVSLLIALIFEKYKVFPKEDPRSTDNLQDCAVEKIIPFIERLEKHKYIFLEVLKNMKRDNQSNQEFDCPSRFEARIRTIVMDCIESHLSVQNFEEKKNEVLRDWHVVQYLLPCFVALYVKICESNDSEHEKLKNRYAKFIDKLISTYEKNGTGIRKSSWSNVLQDINRTPALKESCLNNNHEELSNFFTKVSNLFVEKIMEGASNDASDHLQCCSLFQAFFEVIQKKTGDLDENDVVATEASAYWNWLMWDFFSRMNDVLEESK